MPTRRWYHTTDFMKATDDLPHRIAVLKCSCGRWFPSIRAMMNPINGLITIQAWFIPHVVMMPMTGRRPKNLPDLTS